MTEPNPYEKNGPRDPRDPHPAPGYGPQAPGVPPGYGAPGPGAGGHGAAAEGPEYTWGPPPGQVPGYAYPHPAPGLPQPAGPAPYGYPGAPDGPGATLPAAPGPTALAGGSPLVRIGDITVLNTGSVVTPSGTLPLRGAVWDATDMSRTEERIPAYAIVLTVVLFFLFFLFSLLFLLIKERRTTGYVQVTVVSGGKLHSTLVPALSPMTFQQVMHQVNYARSISV